MVLYQVFGFDLYFYAIHVNLLNNADNFLLHNNAMVDFLSLESLKEKFPFHDLSYVFKHKHDIFFSFLV